LAAKLITSSLDIHPEIRRCIKTFPGVSQCWV